MSKINPDHQVFFGCSDFSGLFRGRAIISKDYLKKIDTEETTHSRD